MKKQYKKHEEEKPMITNEPSVEYRTHGKTDSEYNMPADVISLALESAKESIQKGYLYSTEEVMKIINKEMGWS
jgi:hypothetical protein